MGRLIAVAALGGMICLAACGRKQEFSHRQEVSKQQEVSQWQEVSQCEPDEVAESPDNSRAVSDRQITLAMQFIACPVKVADGLAVDWKRFDPDARQKVDRLAEPPANPTTAPAAGRADRILGPPVILRWATLEEKGRYDLIQFTQGFSETRMLNSPRITLRSGQQSWLTFATGGSWTILLPGASEAGENEFELLCIGRCPRSILRGRILSEKEVAIACRFDVSECFFTSKLPPAVTALGSDTVPDESPLYRSPPTYYRVAACKTLVSGQTLALRLYPAKEIAGPDMALMILIKAQVIIPRQTPTTMPKLPSAD